MLGLSSALGGTAATAVGGGTGGKGGGQTQSATVTPSAASTVTPSASAGSTPNVYDQSASAYTGALQGTQAAMGYQPQQVYAQTAAGGIGTYMNPYTNDVINASMADLERQRQTQMNSLGAQATAARAFGGSRQGVAEALTNEGFAQQGGLLASQLRQQGFDTALGASQQDVSNMLQAQGMNQQAGLQGAQQAMTGANQLGNLSSLGFDFGQQIGATQSQEGQLMQALNQALIDAAKGQYSGFTGAPEDALSAYLAALGGSQTGQSTQTSTSNPGLFDYLTAGAGILGALCWVAREVYGEEDGRWVQFRTWLLNDAPKWLLNLYAKHGEWFAGVVRKAPILKRALRPLMDRARRAAGFVG